MPTIVNKQLQQTPPPPETLGGIGREHWKILLQKLIADGRVTDVDLSVLEIACDYWALYRTAEDPADKRRAADEYIKIVKMFGVTPESRIKLDPARPVADTSKKNKLTVDDGDYWGDLLDGIA